MKNKIIVGLALFGLIGTIAYLGYTKYTEITKSIANPLQAIPTNAAIIVKAIIGLKKLNELKHLLFGNKSAKMKSGNKLKTRLLTHKKPLKHLKI